MPLKQPEGQYRSRYASTPSRLAKARMGEVCFGSKADITQASELVCFVPTADISFWKAQKALRWR